MNFVNSKNNKLFLGVDFDYSNVAEGIYKIISVYSSLGVERELTKRQTEFYVALVICVNLDLDIYSTEADKIFHDIYGKHRKYDRKDILKEVVSREWAKINGGDIILPDFLRQIEIKEGSFVFNIKVEWS